MSNISFKKFVEFVSFDGEPSDEQINEIFGLFRNNAKLDKLKAEREKLKATDAKKKAALDQALKDFAAGKKRHPGEEDEGNFNPLERGTGTMRSRQASGRAAERDWVANMGEGKNEDAEEWQRGQDFALHLRKQNKEPNKSDMANWSKPFMQGFRKGWGAQMSEGLLSEARVKSLDHWGDKDENPEGYSDLEKAVKLLKADLKKDKVHAIDVDGFETEFMRLAKKLGIKDDVLDCPNAADARAAGFKRVGSRGDSVFYQKDRTILILSNGDGAPTTFVYVK